MKSFYITVNQLGDIMGRDPKKTKALTSMLWRHGTAAGITDPDPQLAAIYRSGKKWGRHIMYPLHEVRTILGLPGQVAQRDLQP